MKIIPKLTLGGITYRNVEVEVGKYANNGATSLVLYVTDDLYREPLAVASVNVPDFTPSEGCVWIKSYSENEGMLEGLSSAGIIEPTGIKLLTGFSYVHEARLLVGEENA